MIILYTIFNLTLIKLSFYFYKKKYNPISLYAIVWEIALIIHECGMIHFYTLSATTWLIIFLFQIVFVAGCLFGNAILYNDIYSETSCDLEKEKSAIKKWIIVSLTLAGIGIVADLLHAVSIYGTDLLSAITDIYAARVNNSEDLQTIPYIGSFIFVAFPLLGVYTKKFGFTIMSIIAFVLVFADSLTSGGRAGIVFAMLLFVTAFLMEPAGTDLLRRQRKFSRKTKILLVIGVILFVAMLVVISQQRAAGIVNVYATDRYRKVFGNDPVIYKALCYIGGPIGALNEYLKKNTFYFGKNTFLPIYNILARLGLISRIDQYQEFFSTPYKCNVASWARELIEDFTLVGGIFAAFIFSSFVGFFYKVSIKYGNIKYILLFSISALIVALSFFDWKLRSSSIWITFIFSALFGSNINKRAYAAN